MFLSLSLRNFKKHESLQVNFTEGLNGIFGPNYRGKSTILYGLLYALGGASHVPGNRIARRGSDGRFQVEAELAIGGQHYRVVRTKSTANLYLNGADEPVASGTTGVNDELEKVIGMTLKQWKELHYAKQKNAHSLLRYSANNLHQLMRRLVGADELDQVQVRLKDMASLELGVVEALSESFYSVEECQAAIDQAAELVKGLAAKVEAGQAEIANLIEQEQQGLQAIQKATDRLTKAQEEKGAAETLVARLEAATRGVEAATAEENTRAQTWEQAKQALQAVEARTDAAAGEKIAKFESLKLRRAAAERSVEQAQARLDAAKQKVERLSQAATASSDSFDALWRELAGDDLVDLLAGTSALVQQAQQDLAVAKQKSRDLYAAKGGAECPTCKRPFEGHDPAKLQEEIDAARDVQVALEDKILNLSNQREGLELQKKRLDTAQRVMEADADHLRQAQHAVTDAEGDLNDAQDALREVAGDEGDLGLTAEDVEALRNQSHTLAVARQQSAVAESEWKRASAALDSANTALKHLQDKGRPADIEALAAEIGKLSTRVTKDRATLVELRNVLEQERTDLAANQRALSNAQGVGHVWGERLKKLQLDAEKRTKAEKRLALIRHLQKHLKDNAEGYMGKVWAAFLAKASRFVSQCTGGDIEGLERTDDGAFVFIEEGEQMQLEEASGAQEAIIGLAVQMALSAAAPCHLNLLLLDEPTADMDPTCSMATLVAMKAMGQQVVFVSHQQTDNTLCDNAITL